MKLFRPRWLTNKGKLAILLAGLLVGMAGAQPAAPAASSSGPEPRQPHLNALRNALQAPGGMNAPSGMNAPGAASPQPSAPRRLSDEERAQLRQQLARQRPDLPVAKP